MYCVCCVCALKGERFSASCSALVIHCSSDIKINELSKKKNAFSPILSNLQFLLCALSCSIHQNQFSPVFSKPLYFELC